MAILLTRQSSSRCSDGTYSRNGDCYSNNDGWSSYGRWLTVAAIIAGGFFIFFMFACITARRRRSRNMAPYRGTGWAAGRPTGHGPAQYTGGAQPYYNNQQQPAPPYSAAPQQGYYGNQGNQGYFGGGQQNGVELQQPQSSYQPQAGGDPVYNPPAGPPPGKQHDGIIR